MYILIVGIFGKDFLSVQLQPNSAVKLIMDYTKEDIKKGIAKDDTITSAIKGDWSLEKSAQAYSKRHGFTGGVNT